MPLRGDDRAASVQVGAVILFGFIVVAMAVWQAQVVPAQNAAVEFRHNQRVQDDMQTVRNSIVSAPGDDAPASVAVDMAPEYRPRVLFVNPPEPSGTIRTVGTTRPSVNLTVANATALDGDAADFWAGNAKTYNTGALLYEPQYNRYTSAPATVYENTVLYNRHLGGAVARLADQDLVSDTTLTLVTLNGSLDLTTASAYTVDPTAISASTRTVSVTNATGNVTVSFGSRRNASWWTETLQEELVANGGHVVDVRSTSIGDGFHQVTLELEGNVTYTLRMAKVGVGSGATETAASYVVDVAGNGTSVPAGGTAKLVVEVRDRFNNPVAGVTVRAEVSTGSLASTTATTGGDGRAVFTYEAPTSISGDLTAVDVNVTFASGVDPGAAGFDADAPRNLTMALTVRGDDGGGGGPTAYATTWTNPESQAGVTCSDTDGDGDVDRCTVDASRTDTVTLTADTTPTAEHVRVDFGVNDSAVATLSPWNATTGTDGRASTTFEVQSDGVVKVYAASGGTGDVLTVVVENASQPPTVDTFEVTDRSNNGQGARYDVTWAVSDPDGDLQNVTVYVNNTDTGATTTYTGPSGSVTYNPAGKAGYRDSFEIKIVAKDAEGNRVCWVITDRADGTGSYTKADATKC